MLLLVAPRTYNLICLVWGSAARGDLLVDLLYAISGIAVRDFITLNRGPLERSEGVEMYRFLENGIRIKMVRVKQSESLAVDVPGDIEKVERALSEKLFE